jgi:hypothetical protein
MEGSIADAVVERFLSQLASELPQGEALSGELRRLIDGDSLRREDTLIDLYRRIAERRP